MNNLSKAIISGIATFIFSFSIYYVIGIMIPKNTLFGDYPHWQFWYDIAVVVGLATYVALSTRNNYLKKFGVKEVR